MTAITIKSNTRVFGGQLLRFTHESSETKCTMTVAVYLPYVADRLDVSYNAGVKFPAILYLSGLTCTDENVCQKSGVFRYLAENQIAFIAPDTSPRGANIPGEEDSWDFGTGAGFYLDATENPWNSNYRMYSYVTKELLSLIHEQFPTIDINKLGITGHSMGGHGALTIAIKNPNLFKSVSAFAPICNPTKCPWGVKAFSGYLGADNKAAWNEYDATELIKKHGATTFYDILIDVGTADSFLTGGQLLPQEFARACEQVGQRLTLRYQDGYDHSYYFISSFIEDHILFHANRLLVKNLDSNSEHLYT